MGVNKDLGLPFGDGMQRVAVCFDVDGTLVLDDVEIENTTHLLLSFLQQPFKNVDVIVWSGGGAEYAETMLKRCEVPSGFLSSIKFHSKLEYKALRGRYSVILAIDDVQDTRLGDINLIVRNK